MTDALLSDRHRLLTDSNRLILANEATEGNFQAVQKSNDVLSISLWLARTSSQEVSFLELLSLDLLRDLFRSFRCSLERERERELNVKRSQKRANGTERWWISSLADWTSGILSLLDSESNYRADWLFTECELTPTDLSETEADGKKCPRNGWARNSFHLKFSPWN